jgi:glutamine amidotransferase-like uncharacterized protein
MSTALLKRKRVWLAVLVIGIIIVSSVAFFYSAQRSLEGVRVSIFADNGVGTPSKLAAQHMFEWMGAKTTIINKTDMLNGILNDTDLLVMPGGCWCEAHCSIDGENELELVRQYVLNGGAYFGIDGGASYGTSYRTDLFDGVLYPDVFGSGYFLTDVDVNKDSEGPDLSGEPASYSLLYERSGYFDIEGMNGIIPICSYHNTSYYCMIAFEAGNGRVFLSSPHPEYEEGTLNDGTDYFDRLNDPDSEWPLMLKIAQWLLRI